MRRLLRWALNVSAAVSAVLFVGVSVGWVLSYRTGLFGITGGTRHHWIVKCARGRISVERWTEDEQVWRAGTFFYTFKPDHVLGRTSEETVWVAGPFGRYHVEYRVGMPAVRGSVRYWSPGDPPEPPPPPEPMNRMERIEFPAWAAAGFLLVGSLPLVNTLRRFRRSRFGRGACRQCGYDLRATPGRCPECGTVPKRA